MGGCRGAVGIGTALQRLIRPSEKTKPEHFACSGFSFFRRPIASKACFEFKLRHPDNETFADAVFKLIRAFDAAPRRADLRTAVVLIGFARVQNRLLFNQAGMTDLLCLTVSVGDFPKR